MAEFNHKIRISIDSAKAKSDSTVVRGEFKKIGQNAEFTGKRIDKASRKNKKSVESLTKAFRGLGAIIGFIGLSQAAKLFVQTADAMLLTTSRVNQFTSGAEETDLVMRQLADVSNRTFTSIQKNAALFARFALVTKDLGLSTKDVVDLTEALQLTFRLSGSGAAEAASSALQLSQALGAGALRGDEFRSIMEANAKLAQLLAKEMKVPIGALKELSRQGKITAEVIQRATIGNIINLRKEADGLAVTAGASFQVLINNATVLADKLNRSFGIIEKLNVAILFWARLLDDNKNAQIFPNADAAESASVRIRFGIERVTKEIEKLRATCSWK